MSRWRLERFRSGKKVVRFGVDKRSLAWRTQARDGVLERLPLAGAGNHVAATSAPQASLLHILEGSTRVEICVSNELAVAWIQVPPSSVAGLAELRLVAQARCAHLHGGQSSDWWVAGAWSARRPFVCCAMPKAKVVAMNALLDLHHAADCRLWTTSWLQAIGIWARALPRNGWCSLRTPSRMLLWHCAAGKTDSIASLATTHDDVADNVGHLARQWLQSAAVRTGQALPHALPCLDLSGRHSPKHEANLFCQDVCVPGLDAFQALKAPCEAEVALRLSLLAGRSP